MAETDSVILHHILVALGAAVAEMEGDEDLSQRLHTETRLRLLSMSDEELWELAKLGSHPPERPVELVYKQIKQAVEEHRATASEWMDDLPMKRATPVREGRDDR